METISETENSAIIAVAATELACSPRLKTTFSADYVLANELLLAKASGQLFLVEQDISLGEHGSHVLYSECLLRIGPDAKAGASAFRHLVAAERLGVIREVDDFVINAALDKLQVRPTARLGVNISARSAELDDLWADVFARLDAQPHLAQHLVIEITETSALASGYREFFAELRKRGVKIALDDFGVGHATLDRLAMIRPDIIKVDGSFTKKSRANKGEVLTLRKLTRTLRGFSSLIVLEGVETEEDKETAFAAGIAWLQGFGVSIAVCR